MQKILLAFVLICCVGLLSGCDDDTNNSNSPELDLMINVDVVDDETTEIYIDDTVTVDTDLTESTEESITEINIGDIDS